MSNVPSQLPRYNIASLLKMMVLVAVILAVCRVLGPQKSWLVFIVGYAFAPAIAILVMWALRRHSVMVRYVAAGLTLICFASAMTALCGVFYGSDAMVAVLIGTVIEWPGQLAVLVCLLSINVGDLNLRIVAGQPAKVAD